MKPVCMSNIVDEDRGSGLRELHAQVLKQLLRRFRFHQLNRSEEKKLAL